MSAMKITELLQGSAASDAFVASVERFLTENRPNERIAFSPACPPVKVQRTLTKLLESYPNAVIESVEIDAHSGCEFFRGELAVEHGSDSLLIDFHWDCRWKADQVGWKDYFGFPDQLRAAREFGYDCFRTWKEMETGDIEATVE